MQTTPPASALASQEQLSRAPACREGRTQGVYAPPQGESDALHGSGWSNPTTSGSNPNPELASSEAFGTSQGQHATATATALSLRVTSAGHEETRAQTQQNQVSAEEQAWLWEEEERANLLEKERLLSELAKLEAKCLTTRTRRESTELEQTEREIKQEVCTPLGVRPGNQPAPRAQQPEEPAGLRSVRLPPMPQSATALRQQQEMLQAIQSLVRRLDINEQTQQYQQQMQQLQQTALAALAKEKEQKGPKDLTSAELQSLRCGMRPHEIEQWLTRAVARLCERCKELRGILEMPNEAWLLCCEQAPLQRASSWAAGQLAVMVDQTVPEGSAFMGRITELQKPLVCARAATRPGCITNHLVIQGKRILHLILYVGLKVGACPHRARIDC